MSINISSIHYCPVKSVSFQNIDQCKIDKNIGIKGDRIFAFSQNLDFEQSKLFENNPEERKGKWNKILTLKNLSNYRIKIKNNKILFFTYPF